MSTDLVIAEQHAEAAQAAKARGDLKTANLEYSRELAARGSVTNTPRVPTVAYRRDVEPYTAAEVTNAFTVMKRWEGWHTASPAALRRKWGSDTGANLAIATDFAHENEDVVDVLRHAGLNDHPAIVEACAILGRRYTVQAGDQISTTGRTVGATSMQDEGGDTHETALRSVRQQIREAQQNRESSVYVNKLYAREMELIRRRDGSREIVNGRRTS